MLKINSTSTLTTDQKILKAIYDAIQNQTAVLSQLVILLTP